MGNNPSHPATPITGDENCVICQENINNRISRPNCCPNHFFHHDCLMEWAKHKNTCPLDNKEFTAIIDKKGNEIRVKKPKDDNVELLSTLFERMLLLTQLMRSRFRCDICSEEHSELERAKTDVCDHRFHRRCLSNLARISTFCPVDNCNSEFSEIRCEFGEVMIVADLRESFQCSICNRSINDEETATPNECAHRFHRRCLHQSAKERRECPRYDCKSGILFLKCEKGDRIVIQNSKAPFECSLCQLTDPEKESAQVNPCGHQFHRECFLRRYRNMNNCPFEACNGSIDMVSCQFGDAFERPDNPINNLIATVTCSEEFKCPVCDERSPEWERAKLNCGCEYHRRCIVQIARRQRQLLCLRCQQPYTTITCLHGDSLTVERRVEVPSNLNATSEPSSTTTKESETNTAVSDVMTYTGGAVGGCDIEHHICNLCESPISEGEALRPKDCTHWYHNVCMKNLSNEIGCCISCQADVSHIVDESDADVQIGAALVSSSQTSNAERSTCYTCGDVMNQGQTVRPDGCLCLYHRRCLSSIREIMAFCPTCDNKFNSMIDVA